jgi:hypothetical protein
MKIPENVLENEGIRKVEQAKGRMVIFKSSLIQQAAYRKPLLFVNDGCSNEGDEKSNLPR